MLRFARAMGDGNRYAKKHDLRRGRCDEADVERKRRGTQAYMMTL